MINMKVWSLLIALAWIAAIGPGTIEGRMFPVVGQVGMESADDPEHPGWSLVSGRVVKYRDCLPIELQWRRGSRSRENAPLRFIGGEAVVRELGYFEFDGWRLRVSSPTLAITDTYSDVLHQCFLVDAHMDFQGEEYSIRIPSLVYKDEVLAITRSALRL